LTPNERGWLWCEQLQLWVGTWRGVYQGYDATWLRFYDRDGQLLLTAAEAAQRQAEAERHRANTALAELARLKARLAELESKPGQS